MNERMESWDKKAIVKRLYEASLSLFEQHKPEVLCFVEFNTWNNYRKYAALAEHIDNMKDGNSIIKQVAAKMKAHTNVKIVKFSQTAYCTYLKSNELSHTQENLAAWAAAK